MGQSERSKGEHVVFPVQVILTDCCCWCILQAGVQKWQEIEMHLETQYIFSHSHKVQILVIRLNLFCYVSVMRIKSETVFFFFHSDVSASIVPLLLGNVCLLQTRQVELL